MNSFSIGKVVSKMLLLGCALVATGVAAQQRPPRSEAAAPQPVAQPMAGPRGDITYTWKAYPITAKTPSEAVLLIERETPKSTRPNQEYTYEIKITNRSFYPVDDVVMTETMPGGFVLDKTSITPDKRGNVLRWSLGMMAPGQSEVISIIGKVEKSGKVIHSGEAVLTYKMPQLVAMTKVIEPVLQFRVSAVEEVILEQVFPVEMVFRNVGSAPVVAAVLDHTLTDGIVTEDGGRKVVMNLGDIQVNESVTRRVNLKGVKVGSYENNFVVKAKDGVEATASLKTFVRRPRLEMTARAPRMRFVGNVVRYDIAVKNVGDGPAMNSVTQLSLPNGTKFHSANEAGRVVGGNVVWQVSNLRPGESKEFEARFVAEQITQAKATAVSTAAGAEPVQATLITELAGIPAILTSVSDINDPVPVGETETYVITVENTGSLAATNVVVKCDLEDSMEFVSSTGPTDSKLEARTVVFASLASLPPGGKVTWTAVIRAKAPGDVRFTARVSCDQLDTEVKEEESTTFYE